MGQPTTAPAKYRFGTFELDRQAAELRKRGVRVKLQDQPYRILCLLLDNRGEVVARETLCSTLWHDDTFVEFERSLNAAVAKLRLALGDSAENPRFIETVARRGYRFIAPVEVALDRDTPEPTRESEASLPVIVTGRQWRRLIAATFVVAGLGAVLVIWLAEKSHSISYPDPRVTSLTTDPGMQIQPSFSPDGSRVAYAWNGPKENTFGIYVKLIGSGDPVRITNVDSSFLSPAWSPDGRRIAALRDAGAQEAIVLMPASGGRIMEVTRFSKPWLGAGSCTWLSILTICGYPPSGSLLAWSPDSKYLFTSASRASESPPAIIRVSVETGDQYPMTAPHRAGQGDVGPAVSPDGRALAFIRANGSENADIYLIPLSRSALPAGPPRQLTFDTTLVDPPAWTVNGRELLFASDRGGRRGLWRVTTSGAGKPVRFSGAGENAYGVAISPRGQQMVYGQRNESRNLWRIPLRPSVGLEPVRVTMTTKRDTWAQYSPDGRRIVFESDRSGVHEIWVCEANGSNAFQLTNFGKGWSGSPRWSPDGLDVAFDSNVAGSWDIYLIRIQGGPATRLTTNQATDAIPNWSQDGSWIYFTSNRTGRYEIWKIKPDGSSERQVTTTGGMIAVGSPDGKYLYYKNKEGEGEIWRMPMGNGAPSQLLNSVMGRLFTVTKRGIYFSGGSPVRTDLRFLDFASNSVRVISPLGDWQSAVLSPDEQWALYSRKEFLTMNLLLVENFR
ncbi:MAG TPA: winged helix-turn-helix domain-containing protein [Bryobacteraceae bacterium]